MNWWLLWNLEVHIHILKNGNVGWINISLGKKGTDRAWTCDDLINIPEEAINAVRDLGVEAGYVDEPQDDASCWICW